MAVRSSFYRPPSIKIELEIFVSTTAEADALVSAIQALPAAFSAANQAAITAATATLQTELDAATAALAQEKQDHTDDLAAIQAAAAQVTPAPANQ